MLQQFFQIVDWKLFCQFAGLEPGQLTIREKISKLKENLKNLIEPDADWLASMWQQDILTQGQYEEVDAQTTVNNKNDKLLHHWLDCFSGNWDSILDTLHEAGQEHIVNFIKSGGGMGLKNC
jgi:hypothetical protein